MKTPTSSIQEHRIVLRVNVGLSRKLTKDFNSTGFTVNLEGEVTAPVSDPGAVIQQVHEFFDLAEEALDQQIERTQSVDAIAGHDGGPTATASRNNSRSTQPPDSQQRTGQQNGNGNQTDPVAPATSKQINYLISIGKNQGLSTFELENRIEGILSRRVGLYELTKRQATVAIDSLNEMSRTAPA